MTDILDNGNIRNIHFIGIGGIGMSAIAEILLEKGYNITGSDLKPSNITEKLKGKGVKIYHGHEGKNIDGAHLVVYTSAVKDDNPELVMAREMNIPTYDRAEILGILMKRYHNSIAISGSHGKTTTTSMISLIYERADKNPTILIGGELKEINGNVKVGGDEFLITEACEYKENFLKFRPTIGIILNVDKDHLDYFKDLDHIISTFSKFAKIIPDNGYLIINNDDPNAKYIIKDLDCNVITYGIERESNFTAKNIRFNNEGCPSFDVYYNDGFLENFTLNIPGHHNIYNSLASIAASYITGIPVEVIKETLREFKGSKRRFDVLGSKEGITIVDDYAHHPTEIKAVLKAAKNYPHRDLWCVFQPHTYTRTKSLLKEFSTSFEDADKVIITDIYAAREKNTGEIHSRDLVKLIKDQGKEVYYFQSFEDILHFLRENVKKEDMVITMGAGDIYRVGEMFIKDEKWSA